MSRLLRRKNDVATRLTHSESAHPSQESQMMQVENAYEIFGEAASCTSTSEIANFIKAHTAAPELRRAAAAYGMVLVASGTLLMWWKPQQRYCCRRSGTWMKSPSLARSGPALRTSRGLFIKEPVDRCRPDNWHMHSPQG